MALVLTLDAIFVTVTIYFAPVGQKSDRGIFTGFFGYVLHLAAFACGSAAQSPPRVMRRATQAERVVGAASV